MTFGEKDKVSQWDAIGDGYEVCFEEVPGILRKRCNHDHFETKLHSMYTYRDHQIDIHFCIQFSLQCMQII